MIDLFYREFEEHHRGSRELIKCRLDVYLPYVRLLSGSKTRPLAIDLGCGRGEWLELLTRTGFDALGVDLDDGMLAACRDIGLNVTNAEALGFLKTLPDGSQSVVSGFHLAEHLPFADLRALVAEAFRVLRPAGLLILETPNPENLAVSTNTFFLDPTHVKPIPPSLLLFLATFHGFARSQILRLQEPAHLGVNSALTLQDVVTGVSPDYAVVAQKSARPAEMARFDHAFERSYGVSLDMLLARHAAQEQAAAQHVKDALSRLERSVEKLEYTLLLQSGEVFAAEAETADTYSADEGADASLRDANGMVGNCTSRMTAFETSASSRLMAPLRALGNLLRGCIGIALMKIGVSHARIERLKRRLR